VTAFIGVDVGTTAVKTIAISPEGKVIARAEQGYPLSTPREGWSEQDPEDWSFMLGAVGVGGLLYGGMPRWLAASGGVVGAALFINAAANLSSANTFFIGELLFLLWVVVASITLMIRVGAPSPSLARAEVAVARA
jgi:hypothetical protein